MQIKPTRMGLLTVKRRLKLASKGYKLLKDKQDGLVMEFYATLKEIRDIRKEILGNFKHAQGSLLRAQALSGINEINDIANGLSQKSSFQVGQRSVMGVKIPEIKDITVNNEWYGYLSGNIELDNSVKMHRELFPKLMKLIEKQIILSKIAEDIKKTKRKVNSLDYIIIPKLKYAKKKIQLGLEELERDNFTRLKKVKAKRQ
jgi:V/A-type H+/Na+-transporting ATPase subunit D